MIKCLVYRGRRVKYGNEFHFVYNDEVEEGQVNHFDEKEFELLIKKNAKILGYSIDALDKDGDIFWSNYQDVPEKKASSELDKLIEEFETLSGEKAKGNWGVKKLTELIEELKTKKE